jgi:predicted dehydrogenase
MIEPEKVRVSFIGAGGICEQRHLPGLAQIPGVELVSVCNRSVESSERIKQKCGFERIESEWRKVIDDPTVHAIFIGTWPYLHCELSLAALTAGKHVFCQARMCMDWNEAQQMTAAAAAHPQLVNMICPSPFRVRWERTVKQVLAAPEFGQLQMVNVDSRNFANGNPNQVSWREQIRYSGLNILQVGIFAETLNAWCGEYATLTATTKIELPEKRDAVGQRHEIQVPQVVQIRGKLAAGALIAETHSGLSPQEISEITLFGTEKTCHLDLLAGNVQLLRKQGPSNKQVVDSTGDPWQVEAEFIAAVRAARRGESWQVSGQINPDFSEASRYMRKMQLIHDCQSK